MNGIFDFVENFYDKQFKKISDEAALKAANLYVDTPYGRMKLGDYSKFLKSKGYTNSQIDSVIAPVVAAQANQTDWSFLYNHTSNPQKSSWEKIPQETKNILYAGLGFLTLIILLRR